MCAILLVLAVELALGSLVGDFRFLNLIAGVLALVLLAEDGVRK